MIIPHTELAPDTLKALIEEIVTRDGTDYGKHEVSMASKVEQVMKQLQRKEIFITYDKHFETCSLVTREIVANMELHS